MKEKERKLTKAEVKRREVFEERAQELSKQGYLKKDLTMGVVKANVLAIVVMVPVAVLFCYLYFAINGGNLKLTVDAVSGISIILLFLILIICHELVHGITWAIFAKQHFKAVEFGVIWSMLTPYCTCKSELTRKQYILGGIMPTIIVGVIPAIVAIIFHYDSLFLLSLMMIIGGGGDVLIILKLLFYKEKGKCCMYIDHPYELGVVVFEAESN